VLKTVGAAGSSIDTNPCKKSIIVDRGVVPHYTGTAPTIMTNAPRIITVPNLSQGQGFRTLQGVIFCGSLTVRLL